MTLLHSIIKGEGTPLLILHGFLGMADNWKTLGNRFSENGFQVHLIDQRNHGRSFHADAFSYDLLREDLLRYIKHHQLENCHIIGHSMGGKTAMFFAVAHPELLSKLIVVDIAPRYYEPHHGEILLGLQALAANELSSRKEADTMLSDYVDEPAKRQFLLKNLYWSPEKTLDFRFHLESLVNHYGIIGEALPAAQQYRGKTLFIKGEHGGYITPEDEQDIATQFPNAVIHEIKEAGHWVHADQPEIFFTKAMTFLKPGN